MPKRVAEKDEDLVMSKLRYTKEQFDEVLSMTEEYVRANPGQAMLYAFVAGYVLNRLPVGGLLRGAVRLSMFALKPAILIYGATKLYEASQNE